MGMDEEPDKVMIYQIIIQGRLDMRWSDWFSEKHITPGLDKSGNPITILTGPVIDQVALRGLLIKIWDLNIELVSVNRIDA